MIRQGRSRRGHGQHGRQRPVRRVDHRRTRGAVRRPRLGGDRCSGALGPRHGVGCGGSDHGARLPGLCTESPNPAGRRWITHWWQTTCGQMGCLHDVGPASTHPRQDELEIDRSRAIERSIGHGTPKHMPLTCTDAASSPSDRSREVTTRGPVRTESVAGLGRDAGPIGPTGPTRFSGRAGAGRRAG